MKCVRCGWEHKGTEMRTHPNYDRIRNILHDPAMPRDERGRYLLCHSCQRHICWHGGVVVFLANQVKRQARYPSIVIEPKWNI